MAKSTLWASFKKSLLYRWRYIISFTLMGLLFVTIIIIMPLLVNIGVNEAEMASAVASHDLSLQTLFSGGFINAPFLALQKLSIHLFGLTAFSIKLPAIVFGILSGFLMILLLNRWFVTSVAVIASVLTISTTGFLFVATTGVPTASYLLLLVLILWLGSKILGETPSPIIPATLAITLGLALYVPYMIYLVLTIVLISLIHPHLRFAIKTLPKLQLILSIALFLLTISPIVISAVTASIASFKGLFWFENANIAESLKTSLSLFAFKNAENLPVLVPIIPLPIALLSLTGLALAIKNHHTSRNYLLLAFIIFSFVALAFSPDLFPIILLPIAILLADGVQFLLERWNMTFPNNSYAKFIGMLPIIVFTLFLFYSSVNYHFFGYRNLKEVNMFYTNDLYLLSSAAETGDIVLVANNPDKLNFYRILEDKLPISVVDKMPDYIEKRVITSRTDLDLIGNDLSLRQIITNDRYDDADRLYIFEK
jgi:hypothetical protein